ncbi:MAG: radical SAM protein [Armatimonadota bacterium]
MYINEVLELSAPVFCFLEITNLCNNKCPGCGNVFEHGIQKQLSLAQWEKAINEISEQVSSVRVTGGEASLREDFWEILDLLENKNLCFSVFSNGRWKSPEKFLDKIKSYKYFKGFLISLHGHNAESHDKWSGVEGSFNETTGNLKLAAGKNIIFSTNAVISPYNYNFIKEITDLAFSLGARGAVFNRFYQSGEESLKAVVSEKELLSAISSIEKLKRSNYKNFINYGNCIPHCFCHSASNGCTTGTTFCTIDPFGNMRPCNHAEYIAGNILEKGFLNIWKSEKMRIWRGYIPGECKKCAAFLNCHGGCRALGMKYGQDPLMKTPIVKTETIEDIPEVKINKHTKVRLNTTKIRQEKFGYLLMNNDSFSAVKKEAYDFLANLNRFSSIEEIYKEKGEEAVALLYKLYNRGIIAFENSQEKTEVPA